MLGAPRRRRTIPGFCGELRASRLPGALVSAIRLVHVPVSWRSVLPRRLACLGSAGTRACSNIPTKLRDGLITIQAGELPTPGAQAPLLSKSERCRHAPDQHKSENGSTSGCSSRRPFATSPSIRCRGTPRAGGTSSAAPRSPYFILQLVTGNSAGADLCSLRQLKRGAVCRP